MIVATAGHIDHGKTTLVKALTGVDTDRLPEEKKRGISIDIGFAYRPLPDGRLLAFVDVPGHERFIHNMLAGVAAIDFALLVVAADDGVMPQTREHLHILDLFGVHRGIAVITKTDRVSPERVAQVRGEVGALLTGTALEGAAVMEASAPTGQGIPELQNALAVAAAGHAARRTEDRGFRFVIDRAFSAPGSGTVVTGTVLDGEVKSGDKLQLSPGGQPVRVRGLHKRGEAAEEAKAGERCAINIAGADPKEAARGSWLTAPHAHAPTQRLDVELRLLPSDRKPVKHWDAVHFHLGTADVMARLVMPGETLAPGRGAIVQLVLDKHVAAARGDRFVVRDASAQHTLGGGSVIDPFALPPRGRQAARAERIEALQQPDAHAAWTMLLERGTQGVQVQPFRRAFNLTPAAMRALIERSRAATPGGEQGSAFGAAQLAAMEQALVATLDDFHAKNTHAPGMDTDRLLRAAFPKLAQRERVAILRAMSDTGKVEVRGSLVLSPGHVAKARASDEKLWRTLAPLYEQWGANVPLLREVAARSGVEEAPLRDVLKQRALTGDMVRIAPERFLPRERLSQLAQVVVHLGQAAGGEFTIAQYRDLAGVGRNLSIEVLEYFDKLGLTQRGGEGRSIRCLDAGVAAALARPDWRPPRFTASPAGD